MKNSSEPYGFSFTRLHLIDSSDIDPASQFSHKQISQKSKPNGNPERSQSTENLCCFLKKNPIRSDLSILVTGDVLFSWKQQGMFNSVSPGILNENKSQLNYLREEK